MKFNDRLKALRNQASMTQKELSERLNVSVVTVRNWELGNKSPSMSAIISLAETFHVATDYMLGVISNPALDYALLNNSEKALLSNYRALDRHGRKAVDTICLLEKRRVAEETVVESDGHSTQMASRYIPRYATPSAAGFSVPLDGDDFEMILVDGSVPGDADFAVGIQGNSMSPYIHDGDTVYVKKNAELSIGDVGIFSVDGAMYCKQYFIDEAGNLTLVSANPRLKYTNVYVSTESGADVRCYGKVLLGTKIPLPDYFTKSGV